MRGSRLPCQVWSNVRRSNESRAAICKASLFSCESNASTSPPPPPRPRPRDGGCPAVRISLQWRPWRRVSSIDNGERSGREAGRGGAMPNIRTRRSGTHGGGRHGVRDGGLPGGRGAGTTSPRAPAAKVMARIFLKYIVAGEEGGNDDKGRGEGCRIRKKVSDGRPRGSWRHSPRTR